MSNERQSDMMVMEIGICIVRIVSIVCRVCVEEEGAVSLLGFFHMSGIWYTLQPNSRPLVPMYELFTSP
jgi:hypothetical protein